MKHSLLLRTKISLSKLTERLYDKLGRRNYILLCSVIVGVVSGTAAILLKKFVELLYGLHDFFETSGWSTSLIVASAVLGIAGALIVQKIIFPGLRYEKSLSFLIYIIERNMPQIPFRKTFSHLLTSGISVGLGGSAGLEAPIVMSGAAIGSNTANYLRLDRKDKILLLACGTAAGISAIFNSPVAGVLFTAEVMLTEFSIASLIPILIASASAAVVSRLFYSGQLFLLVSKEWYYNALPFYLILGIISALVGVYMIKSTYILSHIIEKYLKTQISKVLAGGLSLGILIVLFPPLFGEGYTAVEKLFNSGYSSIMDGSPLASLCPENTYFFIAFCLLIIITKAIATTLTIECGGDGGIFASAMFAGAFTGFIFAYSVNMSGIASLNAANFTAAGMCGVFTAVLRAPLTGIFLIAEVTGGYILFIPLMIVAAIAFFAARYIEPYSIYTKSLAAKKLLCGEDKDSLILSRIRVASLIEKDYVSLKKDDPFTKILEAVTESKKNIFPVIEENGKLAGVVQLDNVRAHLMDENLNNAILVYDVMENAPYKFTPEDTLKEAMDAFEHCGAWNLPVISHEDGRYMGFISKSGIFARYREMVKGIGRF